MAILPSFGDESPFEDLYPLGSKQSRAREAEKIRQDFVKKSKPLPPFPLKRPAGRESSQNDE
jgi:hypothetical protein